MVFAWWPANILRDQGPYGRDPQLVFRKHRRWHHWTRITDFWLILVLNGSFMVASWCSVVPPSPWRLTGAAQLTGGGSRVEAPVTSNEMLDGSQILKMEIFAFINNIQIKTISKTYNLQKIITTISFFFFQGKTAPMLGTMVPRRADVVPYRHAGGQMFAISRSGAHLWGASLWLGTRTMMLFDNENHG